MSTSEDHARITELEHRVDTLTWLHAELCEQLDKFVAAYVVPQQDQINTLAWLHTELVGQLKEVFAHQQALVARARAIRLAQANTAKTKSGIR